MEVTERKTNILNEGKLFIKHLKKVKCSFLGMSFVSENWDALHQLLVVKFGKKQGLRLPHSFCGEPIKHLKNDPKPLYLLDEKPMSPINRHDLCISFP